MKQAAPHLIGFVLPPLVLRLAGASTFLPLPVGMLLLALVPPLWRRIMDPRVAAPGSARGDHLRAG